MKVILTGTTGYVGAEVLRQALDHPKVTSIVTLTRRPLADSNFTKGIDASSAKLQSIIVKDFASDYAPDVVEALKGADAVIWNLGTVPGKGDIAEVQKTAVDMSNVAVRVFDSLGRDAGQAPLKFVYVSGAVVSRDQDARLWVAGEFRKLRGKSETIFVEAESQHPKTFKTHILRMGGVVSGLASAFSFAPLTITLQQAAASMIEVALNGSDKQTLSNGDMKKLGQIGLSAR